MAFLELSDKPQANSYGLYIYGLELSDKTQHDINAQSAELDRDKRTVWTQRLIQQHDLMYVSRFATWLLSCSAAPFTFVAMCREVATRLKGHGPWMWCWNLPVRSSRSKPVQPSSAAEDAWTLQVGHNYISHSYTGRTHVGHNYTALLRRVRGLCW